MLKLFALQSDTLLWGFLTEVPAAADSQFMAAVWEESGILPTDPGKPSRAASLKALHYALVLVCDSPH